MALACEIVTKRYNNRTHKFGIEVPHSWDDCMILDTENGNTMWQDAVKKDMKNVRIAFKIMIGYEVIPPKYQEIHCYMIFDANMEDFIHNACFVAGGNTTDTLHDMTYASVVSQESVIISLLMDDLNEVDAKMADM
jgi:hypothetical protein